MCVLGSQRTDASGDPRKAKEYRQFRPCPTSALRPSDDARMDGPTALTHDRVVLVLAITTTLPRSPGHAPLVAGVALAVASIRCRKM